MPPEAIYSFKHSLIQDTAYETLLHSTCRQHHGRVADVLLHDFPTRALAEPEVVARHFSAAKQPRKAVDYWYEAGQRANERSELVEAVSNLQQGLSELLGLEDSPARSERELDFRIALGASLLAVEGWSAASVEGNYQRVYALSQSSDDSVKKVNVLRGLGNVFFLKGEVGKSRALAQRQLATAQAEGNRDQAMGGYRSLGMCSFFTGDFSAALADLKRANEIYDPEIHGMQKFFQGTDPAVIGLSMTAWVHWFLGDGAAARDNMGKALAHGEAIQHPFSQTYAHSLAASMYQFRRDGVATQHHAEAAITLARQNDYPYWFGWAKVMRGWAMAAQGKCAEGLLVLQDGLKIYQGTGALQITPYIQTLMAEIYGWSGQPELGIAVLGSAYGKGNETDVTFYEAEALRVHGELLRQSGTGNGREHFQRSLDMATSQNAPALQLRAAMSLYRTATTESQIETDRGLVASINGQLNDRPVDPDHTDALAILAAEKPR